MPHFHIKKPIVFKALALAMGVAVVALSCLGTLEPQTANSLLGIGLACAGISLFADAKTLIKMAEGKLGIEAAFLTGKIKAEGNLGKGLLLKALVAKK